MASIVISYLCRYPVILKFLNWYESRLGLKYALLSANRNSKANFFPDMIARTVGRRMVVTKSGYLGLAPDLAEIGHCVTIIKGAKVPLILRSINNMKWELIGDCYIHGIMHGERRIRGTEMCGNGNYIIIYSTFVFIISVMEPEIYITAFRPAQRTRVDLYTPRLTAASFSCPLPSTP